MTDHSSLEPTAAVVYKLTMAVVGARVGHAPIGPGHVPPSPCRCWPPVQKKPMGYNPQKSSLVYPFPSMHILFVTAEAPPNNDWCPA